MSPCSRSESRVTARPHPPHTVPPPKGNLLCQHRSLQRLPRAPAPGSSCVVCQTLSLAQPGSGFTAPPLPAQVPGRRSHQGLPRKLMKDIMWGTPHRVLLTPHAGCPAGKQKALSGEPGRGPVGASVAGASQLHRWWLCSACPQASSWRAVWQRPHPGCFPDAPPLRQGLFVLLFHCVLNREVRKHLKGVLAGKKPHPDDSATTRATLLTVGGPQWGGAALLTRGLCGCVNQTLDVAPWSWRSSRGASRSRPQNRTSSLTRWSLSEPQACSARS